MNSSLVGSSRRHVRNVLNQAADRAAVFEQLEDRMLYSASSLSPALAPALEHNGQFHPTYVKLNHAAASNGLTPLSTTPTGTTPAQMRTAYGLNNISFGGITGDGAGQTIAIIDAYDDPNINADLAAFDAAFGLAPPPSFRVVGQDGTSNLPEPDEGWAGEIAMDVEWAHVIAPKANILLVEADSAYDSDLWAAVDWAKSQPGVSVVSMSFGGDEWSGQTGDDGHFTTPSGHSGVSFFASSGDSGAFDGWGDMNPGYPSSSPNVVSVGGTSLFLGSGGSYSSESGWDGSGGGISQYESQPSYQNGVVTQSSTRRTTPDIAFDADPNTGVPVYDSYGNGSASPWAQYGGTSLSSPCWAAMTAIVNQGRALKGLASLDGRTQLLPAIYSAPSSNFHDITNGNNGYAAGSGYDLVTGRGSPIANNLVATLSGWTNTTPVGPSNDNFASASTITGQTASVTGTNVNATKQAGEPTISGNVGGKSVWYKWTSPATGTVTLSTAGSSFDTLLGVYKGTSVSGLTLVSSNDDESYPGKLTSKLTFNAVAGTTYNIAVDGYHHYDNTVEQGTVKVALNLVIPAPANDNFASAKVITGKSVTVTGTNVGATRQAGEPKITGNNGGKSVWYSWTAGASGTVTLSTKGSSFDTLLGVYKGTSVSGLTLVKSNDDENLDADILTSKLTFSAVKGTTYRIAVDGYYSTTYNTIATGSIKLTLTQAASSAVTAAGAKVDDAAAGTSVSAWSALEAARAAK